MKKPIIILGITALVAGGCCGQINNNKQVNNMTEETEKAEMEEIDDDSEDGYFNKMVKIANADYGMCYTIGNYRLCPEKKLICVGQMFGTAVIDAFGFFPDTTLMYDEETMIIFAGQAFFDKSDLNIDWQTVQLLSYQDHYSEFTDGKIVYSLEYGGSVHTYREKYDKNTYKPYVEKKSAKINHPEFRELTESFHIEGNTFCHGSLSFGDEVEGDEDFNRKEIWKNFAFTPILEPFDVPNLRTVVSTGGFETGYITDGTQVLYGSGSVSYTEKNGKEYVLVKECIVEGVDFASLRVLGKNMLADKNALYCGAEVIPFNKLNGFKFIIREIE